MESAAVIAADFETSVREHVRKLLVSGKLEVPLQPEVAAKVIAASDEIFDFRQVSTQVHRDQALAGHVLRIANSVAISGHSKIVSIQQALVRLGTRRVKELVVAVAMKAPIFSSKRHTRCAEFIWKEALATSFFARELARHARRNPEAAFLCGLLHTVGKQAVLRVVTELESAQGWDLQESIIKETINDFYVSTGERLIRPWSLPSSVAEAIRCHQRPEDALHHKDMVTIVAVARNMANAMLQGANAKELSELPDYGLLHFYPDDVEKILTHLEAAQVYLTAKTTC
ncbi:MAG: HDOD domain-containing protein [Myxococcales bacterium]|nr:HDOD domain-containing protein [Myxococcales bacterium]